MKKSIFLTIILSSLCLSLVAQERKAKRDASEYLPKAGDFGISVSASPFLYYLGNMFNGTDGNGFYYFGDGGFHNNYSSITGKYMLTNKLGVRASVGWRFVNETNNYYVQDDEAMAINSLSEKDLVDSESYKSNGIEISAGIEYRIGKRRLQGLVGGGIVFGGEKAVTKYTYGNAITEINKEPSTSLDSEVTPPYADGFPYMRYLSHFSNDPSYYAGIFAFVGVEWFMAPQISISGEIRVVAEYWWNSPTYATAEGFNTLSNKTEVWTELLSPGDRGFWSETGYSPSSSLPMAANISVNFYF